MAMLESPSAWAKCVDHRIDRLAGLLARREIGDVERKHVVAPGCRIGQVVCDPVRQTQPVAVACVAAERGPNTAGRTGQQYSSGHGWLRGHAPVLIAMYRDPP